MEKINSEKVARKHKAAPKASTIRLQPELQSALDKISDHLGRPKNKLVNQAVAEFFGKNHLQAEGRPRRHPPKAACLSREGSQL